MVASNYDAIYIEDNVNDIRIMFENKKVAAITRSLKPEI